MHSILEILTWFILTPIVLYCAVIVGILAACGAVIAIIPLWIWAATRSGEREPPGKPPITIPPDIPRRRPNPEVDAILAELGRQSGDIPWRDHYRRPNRNRQPDSNRDCYACQGTCVDDDGDACPACGGRGTS